MEMDSLMRTAIPYFELSWMILFFPPPPMPKCPLNCSGVISLPPLLDCDSQNETPLIFRISISSKNLHPECSCVFCTFTTLYVIFLFLKIPFEGTVYKIISNFLKKPVILLNMLKLLTLRHLLRLYYIIMKLFFSMYNMKYDCQSNGATVLYCPGQQRL